MYGRAGLDRFRKAETVEPFSVINSASKPAAQPQVSSFQRQISHPQTLPLQQNKAGLKPEKSEVSLAVVPAQQVTQVGGGQSTWQPPDWAIEPRPGVYYLEVLKDGEVLDQIQLDKRRHIFGRQFPMCDFVLDHQSVSRQHAAVVPHKNGSIFVIDLGSAHGTFAANERLTKDYPVELEVGQSLRFAASTRTYILRKNNAALFPTPLSLQEIDLPSPPDPSNEEAVLAYNTLLNRYGVTRPDLSSKSANNLLDSSGGTDNARPAKRCKKSRVTFRDQVGGELVEVVGISDGADVETEPGPVGVKEGSSLVGKYESLVQTTIIPKGKEQSYLEEDKPSPKGVTDKLQQVLNKVKSAPKGRIYDDLYGESLLGKVGSSWAYGSIDAKDGQGGLSVDGKTTGASGEKPESDSVYDDDDNDDDDDDLFG
ncbi:protein phosphatase 1 regulatory inhibitor subunit PPP1R8 homolog [Aristolochia californica]|uniref:protein phosphatase 1 regulatory inhibitor subunit PPP1R8 homolog n=1 Tax=Aristolochia californica TaxID=171875 RepID=UPI0035D80C1C